MGGKPQTSTPKDGRLKENKTVAQSNKPASTSKGVHTEKYEQERKRQVEGGVTTQQG